MNQVFVSWSGGKDCCLAGYRAINKGLKARYLLNTVTADGMRSCSHGISASVIRAQSQAMGIPVIQPRTTQNTYEAEFKNMIVGLKKDGINGGVFGDIDFLPHREWVERLCGEAGVTPFLPLWGESQDKLIREFVDSGFEAVIVATRADLLGEEWLGRKIDHDFIKELDKLRETKDISPCGEAGEYHSLVTSGPLFQKRLEIKEARKVLRQEHWILEIQETELRPA